MAKQRGNPRGNPNLKDKSNPQLFQKGYDPRRNLDGAPPKPSKLKVLEAAFGGPIEPEFDKQATNKIKLWLTEMTLDELKAFVKRKDIAAFAMAYAKRIIVAIETKDTKVLEEIYNRAFGMPTSKVALTDGDGNDKEGGIMFYIPDNGRPSTNTEQNSAPIEVDKQEVKTTETK